jgi:DNA-binding MarR family transcriptional regulator
MRRSARLLTRYYEEEMRGAGLTPAQFEILAMLSARGSISQCELAEKVGVDQTTLSRNMKVLAGRRWITGGESAGDKRAVVYALSGAGKKVLRAALPHWRRAQDHMRGVLGSEWEMVWSSLERLGDVADAAMKSGAAG